MLFEERAGNTQSVIRIAPGVIYFVLAQAQSTELLYYTVPSIRIWECHDTRSKTSIVLQCASD